MKRIIFLALLCLPLISLSQRLPEKDPNNPDVFIYTEQMPEYPGGIEAMYKFLAENIKYPEEAKEGGYQGKVYLSFIVTKEGNVKDVNVFRGVQTSLDAEAVRVVKMMPRWKPGYQGGEPVNVRMNLPVVFKLDQK